MLKIDKSYLIQLGSETQFQQYVLEKAYRLTDLLSEITKNTELKPLLALKGGTALNFILFDIPRLSVDIDFNYIGSASKGVMLEDREKIQATATKLFKSLGYTVEERKHYALLQYYLNYDNVKGNNDKIKVEINLIDRVPVTDIVEKQFQHCFDIGKFKVLTYSIEELFAQKLRALIERGTGRDLLDVYNLINAKEASADIIDSMLLKKLFIFYTSINQDIRNASLSNIEAITEYDIKSSLLPLLPKKTEFNLSLCKDTVLSFVRILMDFTTEEEQFVADLYDARKFQPAVLFRDIDYNKDVAKHPSVENLLNKLSRLEEE